MDIKFNCPACSQKLSVDETLAGGEVQCPSCSQPMLVPSAPPPPVPQNNITPQRFSPIQPALQTTRAKGFAIWSLVLGIAGIVPALGLATGVFGLVFGITALVKHTTSKGLAIAGTVAGALAVLMIPVHITVLTAAVSGAKFGTGTTVCTSNLKLIGLAIATYQQKHDGKYPESLNVLEKEGLISAKALRCPLHAGNAGHAGYEYSRPSGTDARGIIAWDKFPHKAGKVVVGRNVLHSDLSVRLMTEQQFSQASKAGRPGNRPAPRPAPPAASHPGGVARPAATPRPQAPTAAEMTVSSAISALKSSSGREQRVPLGFLSKAAVTPENRGEVINAVKPLLNDVENGSMAFEVFALWADKEQVPDLIEILRIAPNSQRGNKCMVLLSRMGDARAAEPIAECLTEFHFLRHAKAALAALGDVAKPAVLPYYHHEDGNAREAARELLRGYKATEEEIFAESIKALTSGTAGARHSAIHDLSKSVLKPEQQAAAARAMRPLIADGDIHMRNAVRHALKTLATPADADFLLEQLDSTEDATWRFAAELLVKFRDARAAKPLAAMLGDNKKTYAAGSSLVSLGRAAEPAVIPFLRSDEPATRKRAAEILGDIGTAASLPALKALEKDKDFFTKAAAESAINAIKSRQSGKK